MKLNSHTKETIVNLTLTLDELQHLHQYVQALLHFPNEAGFNITLLTAYNKQLKSIIEEIERNA